MPSAGTIRQLETARSVACLLIEDCRLAEFIAETAVSEAPEYARIQERRKGKRHNKANLSTECVVKRLAIGFALDQIAPLPPEAGQDWLVRAYVAELFLHAASHGSFHAFVACGRFLFVHETPGVLDIYSLVDARPAALKEDSACRAAKRDIMGVLKDRFGGSVRVTKGCRGEEGFESMPDPSPYRPLVDRLLRAFRPGVPCLESAQLTRSLPEFSGDHLLHFAFCPNCLAILAEASHRGSRPSIWDRLSLPVLASSSPDNGDSGAGTSRDWAERAAERIERRRRSRGGEAPAALEIRVNQVRVGGIDSVAGSHRLGSHLGRVELWEEGGKVATLLTPQPVEDSVTEHEYVFAGRKIVLGVTGVEGRFESSLRWSAAPQESWLVAWLPHLGTDLRWKLATAMGVLLAVAAALYLQGPRVEPLPVSPPVIAAADEALFRTAEDLARRLSVTARAFGDARAGPVPSGNPAAVHRSLGPSEPPDRAAFLLPERTGFADGKVAAGDAVRVYGLDADVLPGRRYRAVRRSPPAEELGILTILSRETGHHRARYVGKDAHSADAAITDPLVALERVRQAHAGKGDRKAELDVLERMMEDAGGLSGVPLRLAAAKTGRQIPGDRRWEKHCREILRVWSENRGKPAAR